MATELNLTSVDNSIDLAIYQGATYRLPIRYEGDWTAWTPSSQIRKNYADLDGDIVAAFEFDPPVLDESDPDKTFTLFLGILSAEITEALPIPSKKRLTARDEKKPSINCWVYDFELALNDQVEKVLFGIVEVKLEVTR